MGGFTPYEKANTLCISVLQNHSPIPSSEEDMTCSHASPKYKASTSTTHFLPTLAVRSLPDVTHQELKVHQRPIFILTLYVRKSEECHRGSESRCSKSFGERCALQGPPEGVLSPNSPISPRLVSDVPCRALYYGWFHQTILNNCT